MEETIFQVLLRFHKKQLFRPSRSKNIELWIIIGDPCEQDSQF